MIIEKIVIKSFGVITDLTLDFSEKVNVIEGGNEAGKSTIAAFIRYMLYGFDEKARKRYPSVKRESTGIPVQRRARCMSESRISVT